MQPYDYVTINMIIYNHKRIKMNKINTACLTGHRPKSLPWGYNESKQTCVKFKEILKQILLSVIENGVITFLTGMAEGFDMIGAEIIIDLKKEFPNVKLVAVIPCIGQEFKWKLNQQERYKNILLHCDKKIILSKIYTPNCMNKRNLWMVQHSSVCIACWNGQPSGTANTVKFANQNACKVIVINPQNIENLQQY